MKTLLALAMLAVAGTSFADPVTTDMTIKKNLNNGRGWGIVNPGGLTPPLNDPTNIWPAKSGVGKALDKAAASLGSTTFTCTATFDPDFRIEGADGPDYVLVTKISGCHL